MKTSRKLVLIALFITLGAVAMYDFTLKKVYDKGEFRSRFYGMEKVIAGSFKEVIFNGANFINAQIEYGPKYGIWASKDYKGKIGFTERDSVLTVQVLDKDKAMEARSRLVITCPNLEALRTRAYFKDEKDESANFRFPYTTTVLKGFRRGKINLNLGPTTKMTLIDNALEGLTATVGDKKTAFSTLIVAASNSIAAATFTVPGKSNLQLADPKIGRAKYALGDSASVTLNGKSLTLIR